GSLCWACFWPSPGGFSAFLAIGPAGTTAIGSPPSGSLTTTAQATTATPASPSTPATNCGPTAGSFDGRLRLSWPRAAFRSSADTAQILANHSQSLARVDFHGFATNERGGRWAAPFEFRFGFRPVPSWGPGSWGSAGTPS